MIRLYVKSHQLGKTVLALFLLGLISWIWGQYQLSLPSLRSSETVLVPVILVVPVASAVFIGLSTRTWMGDLEHMSPRRLIWWRLAHALIMLAIATAILAPVMESGYAAYGSTAALRNILGYAGITYFCAAIVGGELSWILPLAYALPLPLVGVDKYGTPESWAWSLQPAGSPESWTWALILVVIGISALTIRAPRIVKVPQEDEN